jgi:hypothetical protein
MTDPGAGGGGGEAELISSNSDFLRFTMKESLSSVGTSTTLDQRFQKCAVLIPRDQRPVCRRAVETFL